MLLFCLIFVSLWSSVKITNGQSINGYSTIYSDEYAEGGIVYQFSYPLPQNYRIFLFMDPCRLNNYSCCMNVFGEAEYPLTLLAKNELERQVVVDLFAEDSEVAQNYQLVYEDGSNVLASQQVAADDSSVLDYNCLSFRVPHLWCAGKNYAFTRSPYRPPCADNNSSLDALGLYGKKPGPGNLTQPIQTNFLLLTQSLSYIIHPIYLTLSYTHTPWCCKCRRGESWWLPMAQRHMGQKMRSHGVHHEHLHPSVCTKPRRFLWYLH